MADMLRVSLCYATPELELLREFEVAPGTTIEAALAASGVLSELGIDLATTPVGIYGKKKPLDTVLHERDRIELYRPLVADPKEARRRRASHKKEAAG